MTPAECDTRGVEGRSDVRIEPGVGRSDLDLADLSVASLEPDGSVGQINLTLRAIAD